MEFVKLPNGDDFKGEAVRLPDGGVSSLTFGTYIFSDTLDEYTGPFKGMNPHGKGKKTFNARNAKNNVYEGDFCSGKLTGRGTLSFGATGDVFTGEFLDGKATGQGTYSWKSGDVAVGEFKDSSLDGKGRIEFASGDVYVGSFVRGRMEGLGRYTYDSSAFASETDAAIPKNGVDSFRDVRKGRVEYVGSFLNDLPHGHGVVTLQSGDVFKGEFVQGRPSGVGEFVTAKGDATSGRFDCFGATGKGRRVFAQDENGVTTTYIGAFEKDLFHGRGTLSCVRSDGEEIYSYVGEFKRGVYEGFGTVRTQTHACGGNFVQGELVGRATFVFPNSGERLEAVFEEGRMVGQSHVFLNDGNTVFASEFLENQVSFGVGILRHSTLVRQPKRIKLNQTKSSVALPLNRLKNENENEIEALVRLATRIAAISPSTQLFSSAVPEKDDSIRRMILVDDVGEDVVLLLKNDAGVGDERGLDLEAEDFAAKTTSRVASLRSASRKIGFQIDLSRRESRENVKKAMAILAADATEESPVETRVSFVSGLTTKDVDQVIDALGPFFEK